MRRNGRLRNEVGRVVVLLPALLAACSGGAGGAGSNGVPGATNLVALASDSTGMKLVAVGSGIWTSADGGVTWLDRTPSGPTHIQQWTAVASDTTGLNLVAAVNGYCPDPRENQAACSGDIWTSPDGGATWTDQTASGPAHGLAWRAVASDASGTNLVAATEGLYAWGLGTIWTSTDSGATWTNTSIETGASNPDWRSLASDASGQKLVAVGSGVWASIDGGVTWTDRTPADPKFVADFGAGHGEIWSSVASDTIGSKLVVASGAEDLWTSSDGGVTWIDTELGSSSQQWVSVASDATGTNLIAAAALDGGLSGDLWTSTNGGATWLDAAASGEWQAAVSNAAGDHQVAVGYHALWTN